MSYDAIPEVTSPKTEGSLPDADTANVFEVAVNGSVVIELEGGAVSGPAEPARLRLLRSRTPDFLVSVGQRSRDDGRANLSPHLQSSGDKQQIPEVWRLRLSALL